MRFLADENVESEWISALRDDGHDIERAVDVDELGVSATDADVLAFAARPGRVLLTADQSDFSDPPTADHAGIVVVTDGTISGGELRTAIRLIVATFPDLSGAVTYTSDWV